MTNIQPSYSIGALAARWSTLALALFLVGSYSFVLAGILPQISEELHETPAVIGYTITAYAMTIAVLAPIIAVSAAKWSRTTLMTLGLAVFVVGVLISAIAPDYAIFSIGRVVAAIGGAALVPTATAAGAAITPAAQRGRAIAVVGLGFTLSSAIGAPLSSAIAAVSSWRVPMLGIAAIGALALPLLGLLVRHVPIGEAISLARRFAVLKDSRILLPLVTTTLIGAGFNMVFTFSSLFTGYEGSALAAILLASGVMSVVGNTVSGPLTDRFSSRSIGGLFIVILVMALVAIELARHGFTAVIIAFAVWGFAAFASLVPLQHRLLAVDARTASVAISWFSTALYSGIALAPVVAAGVLAAGGGSIIPLAAASLSVLGLIVFLLGFPRRGQVQRDRLRGAEQGGVHAVALDTARRSATDSDAR